MSRRQDRPGPHEREGCAALPVRVGRRCAAQGLGRPARKPGRGGHRVAAIEDLFLGKRTKDGKHVAGQGMSINARDEMADFVRVLQQVESGERGRTG